MTPAHVVAARSFVGTPWHHRGRKPGERLDCVGLAVCALQAAGRSVKDRRFYGREPEKDQLREALRQEFGDPLPTSSAREGDIGLFIGLVYPLHVGIISRYRGGLGLIHASNEPLVRKVVESPLVGRLARRWIEVYRVELP